MANTYYLIASNTVGSGGASSVTFSSIPQTYTDLVLKSSVRSTSTDNWLNISFNGTSATVNWSARWIGGTGTAANSSSSTNSTYSVLENDSTTTASTFSNSEIYIPNYTSANAKSLSLDNVFENNATAAQSFLMASLWNNTAAITSMTLTPSSVNIAQYSTFYLYGIKNS